MPGGRRPWGWHELDPAWAERLVADAAIRSGDLVVDVGAGTGALTRPLLDAGARVIAVERHPGRADALARRFGDDIVLVRADAADLRLPRRPFHVVANPPFAVTTALLRRLLAPGSRLVSAHVVLQSAAVHRWTGSGAPGAGRWRRAFDAEPGRPVPRRAFRPPPSVDCRVLVLRHR
ncbi:MAG: rRNA adenine N(6)-methyltransferase family protein [Acidimicrobiales bacterium]